MAKNRNKGFSLIEVIIGVAVLTILLTPVVKQLAQTMRINRLAKEQQYVNENAVSMLEYVQKTSIANLSSTDTSQKVYCKSSDDAPMYVEKNDNTCELYVIETDASGSSASLVDTGIELAYTTKTYQMNDVYLGSRKTHYYRTLVLDDLSNKVDSYVQTADLASTGYDSFSYRVYYESDTAPAIDNMDGFETTSEGSIVRYTTVDGQKYVSAVVVEKMGNLGTSSHVIDDANETKVGTMHDLDSSQVALVNGDSTNYDKQASADLYATAMVRLKERNSERYQQQLENPEDGILTTDGYTDNISKLTKIYVDEDTTNNTFTVKVDIYYSNTFAYTMKDDNGTQHDYNDVDSLQYNVFSQEFDKTSAQPSIYIEYQPFTVDTSSGVQYAASEYVMVENYVEGAKIYLYKPSKDQKYSTDNYTDELTLEQQREIVENDGEYTISSSNSKKVKINLLSLTTAGDKPVSIYTNLSTDDLNGSSAQFYTPSAATALDGTTFKSIKSEKSDASVIADFTGNIEGVDKDVTSVDRLYTATVYLQAAEDSDGISDFILTGAKGE